MSSSAEFEKAVRDFEEFLHTWRKQRLSEPTRHDVWYAATQAAERGAAERERAMLKELEGLVAAWQETYTPFRLDEHNERVYLTPADVAKEHAAQLTDWLAKHAAKEGM